MNANRSLLDNKSGANQQKDEWNTGEDDGSFKENYIYMKESGLVFSSSVLAQRLKQPLSNRPVPFSRVYVCDFELDFISRENTEALVAPIRDLKEKNEALLTDFHDIVAELEVAQGSVEELKD